jgi:hypothetical protein
MARGASALLNQHEMAVHEFVESPHSKNSHIYLSHAEEAKKYDRARVSAKIRKRAGRYEVILDNNGSGWRRLFAHTYEQAFMLAQRARRGHKLF